MELDPSTINEWTEILRSFVALDRERQPFLITVLGTNAPVLQHINWDGSVAVFIPHLLHKLADHGGKQALCAVLKHVRSQVGEDVQHRIDQLLRKLDLPASTASAISTSDIDVVVQKVRDRLHDDIKRLYKEMPLLGVDHRVDLDTLFVDVKILEEVSSSRTLELVDLLPDFLSGVEQSSSDRSLDRMGLGKQQQGVSGLTALRKDTNLMVLGKPGSGKTTYLQRIVTQCNKGRLQPHRIPVLIKLREFVHDGRQFKYSLQAYLTHHWQLSDAEAELVLRQGRALILLDGLDEVAGTDGREMFQQIEIFVRTYPQNQLIVTCRTQSHEFRFDYFDYVEVADFLQSQVNEFVGKYFTAVCSDAKTVQEKTRNFLEKFYLEENKAIRELAITPILLNLTCSVFHKTEKFYSKRSKLYEKGLKLLLEEWDKSRKIERDEIYRDLSIERKQELLSYIAVKNFFDRSQYLLFEEEEIEGYIAEFLEILDRDSRVVLKAIEAQHGLLIKRAEEVWSFSHLTFQEYFVAKSIITSSASEAIDRRLEALITHIYEQQWREIFLLAVEMLNASNSLFLAKLMRTKLNEILENSKEIQKILTWVNKKSLDIDHSMNPNYSNLSASIRAFYCANTFEYALILNRTSESIGHSANALAETLNPKFSLSHIFTIALHFEHKFIIDYNLVLDRALTSILTLAIDIKESLSLAPHKINDKLYTSILASCFHDILNNQYIFDNSNSELEQSLKDLKEQLPNPDSLGLIELWQNWTDKLRSILIKFRDIGHTWELNEDDLKKIQIYFEANKLLVECLKIIKNKGLQQNVSDLEKIEANLLLPLDDTLQ